MKPELINMQVFTHVKRTMNGDFVDSLDAKRGKMMKEALALTASVNGGVADLGAALRMVMIQDKELFNEVAYLEEQKGHDDLRTHYDRFNKAGGEDNKTAFQRASIIDADAGNGDNDFGGVFVESVIKKRVETESGLMKMLDVKRQNKKQDKFPISTNLAKCAFATATADLTDLTDTVDDGFDNITIETEKFGGTMTLEEEVFVKLDAQHISQIFDELTIAYHRGMIDQIINGNGTTPNATGLATNATAVTFSGNVTQTLIKMIAAVADASKGGSKELFILTNSAGYVTLEGEKFIDKSYDDLIDILGGNNFLKRLPVVEENIIVTSGTSPNKSAPLYVGKKGDYLLSTQRDPKIEIDRYTDFKAGGQTVRIMGFWHGQPYFNDSFAKTTIPTIY